MVYILINELCISLVRKINERLLYYKTIYYDENINYINCFMCFITAQTERTCRSPLILFVYYTLKILPTRNAVYNYYYVTVK